ncbi:MAG: histidine phosphatase family protein [Pseudomonadota bacterium]
MPELTLIRHAQASFGAENYDRLSDLGHRQARWTGEWLADCGAKPTRIAVGTLTRHRETAEGIAEALGVDHALETHPGLDEYDFRALLAAWFRERPEEEPPALHTDRRTHFRTLRTVILAWQRDEIAAPPETWVDFEHRTIEALHALCDTSRGDVLAVSSGGPISELTRRVLEAPAPMMMTLNLQAKNTGITRMIFTERARFLTQFNAAPHLERSDRAQHLTFS